MKKGNGKGHIDRAHALNKKTSSLKTKDVLKRMMDAEGELPHEFLLRVMRGEIEVTVPVQVELMDENGFPTGVFEEKMKKEVPDLAMRVDAAKAAAPYFAPKLSAVAIDLNETKNVTFTSITLVKKESDIPREVIDVPQIQYDKETEEINKNFINNLNIKKPVEVNNE